MNDIQAALREFRERHQRIVKYNLSDELFYETTHGKRELVRIPTPQEQGTEKGRLISSFISNSFYENRLSPSDKDLRVIIIKHVQNSFHQKHDAPSVA